MMAFKIKILHIILTALVLHASLPSIVLASDDEEKAGFIQRLRREYIPSPVSKNINIDNRIQYHYRRNLQPPRPKSKQQMRQKNKKTSHDTYSSTNVNLRNSDQKAGGKTVTVSGNTKDYHTDSSMAQTSSADVNSSSQESISNATPIQKNLSVYMYVLAAGAAGIAIASVVIRQRKVREKTLVSILKPICLIGQDPLLSNIIIPFLPSLYFTFQLYYYL